MADPQTFEEALHLIHGSRKEAETLREHNLVLAQQLAESYPRPSIRFKWARFDGDRGESISFACQLDNLEDKDVRESLVAARQLVVKRATAPAPDLAPHRRDYASKTDDS